MSMVCGLDLHRQQITFDALETASGEVWKGRVWQPDRERFRRWLVATSLACRGQPVAMAVEGCTAGDTWSKRSPPPASKHTWPSQPTPRPRGHASGTPRPTAPTPGSCASCCSRASCPSRGSRRRHVLEWRERVRLYKSLVDQRRVWIQRIHAELFQHGVAVPEGAFRSTVTRDRLLSNDVELTPPAGNESGSATRCSRSPTPKRSC